MKFLRTSWMVLIAAVLGFSAGAFLVHAPMVRAQSAAIMVTVTRVPGENPASVYLGRGSQIVGFSCEQDDCYVASTH